MTSLADNSTATGRGEFPVRARWPVESARRIVAGRRRVTSAEMKGLSTTRMRPGWLLAFFCNYGKTTPIPL